VICSAKRDASKNQIMGIIAWKNPNEKAIEMACLVWILDRDIPVATATANASAESERASRHMVKSDINYGYWY
jgi:hypothetical protein